MTTPSTELYREIPLRNKRLVALVDAEDYESLNKHRWWAAWESTTKTYYAIRSQKIDGKVYRFYMHRVILGLHHGDTRTGDHRETSQTLDNRRANLRIADRFEQQRNKRRQSNNTSGFKGVRYVPGRNCFRADIKANGKQKFLGTRKTAIEAAALYATAANQLHREFARLA